MTSGCDRRKGVAILAAVVVIVVVVVDAAVAVRPDTAIYSVLHEFDATVFDADVRRAADRERRGAAAALRIGGRRGGRHRRDSVRIEHGRGGRERRADWGRRRMGRRQRLDGLVGDRQLRFLLA